MKIKCGRREIELLEEDRVLFNGNCYQIITQRQSSGFYNYITPKIAKARAKTLIKKGDLILAEEKYEGLFGEEYDLYKIGK